MAKVLEKDILVPALGTLVGIGIDYITSGLYFGVATMTLGVGSTYVYYNYLQKEKVPRDSLMGPLSSLVGPLVAVNIGALAGQTLVEIVSMIGDDAELIYEEQLGRSTTASIKDLSVGAALGSLAGVGASSFLIGKYAYND